MVIGEHGVDVAASDAGKDGVMQLTAFHGMEWHLRHNFASPCGTPPEDDHGRLPVASPLTFNNPQGTEKQNHPLSVLSLLSGWIV